MKLEQFLSEQKLSRADFARMIGVSEVSVTRYIAGTRMPRTEVLAKIGDVTIGAVTANDFVALATEISSRPFREEAAGESAPVNEASHSAHGAAMVTGTVR